MMEGEEGARMMEGEGRGGKNDACREMGDEGEGENDGEVRWVRIMEGLEGVQMMKGEKAGGGGRGNRGRGKGGRGENGVVSATAIIFQKIVQLT